MAELNREEFRAFLRLCFTVKSITIKRLFEGQVEIIVDFLLMNYCFLVQDFLKFSLNCSETRMCEISRLDALPANFSQQRLPQLVVALRLGEHQKPITLY